MVYIIALHPWKDCYKDDPRVWNGLFDLVARDFQEMEINGIQLHGQGVVFPVILGNKGDWSYLATWPMYNFAFDFYIILSYMFFPQNQCVMVAYQDGKYN